MEFVYTIKIKLSSILYKSMESAQQSAQNIRSRETIEGSSDDVSDDYMGKDTCFLTRWLSLHYFKILTSYNKYYKKKKLINYRPEYEQIATSMFMWAKYRSKGSAFNIYKEVFLAQRGPIIMILIISLIIGVLALFGAYYQRFLFTQLIDHTFETSGWVFFAIISVSAILRFFLFNYAQNLANEIGSNIRCYLENALMKVALHLPDGISDGLLINNFFVSSDLVGNSIKFLPFFVASLVIVFGIVGFIIGIVGHIGWVVLGLTIAAIVIQVFILKWMLHLHHQYVQISDKRTSLLLLGTQMLLKLTYNGLSKIYKNLMGKYRKQETQIDRKYNLGDGIIQILTESVSFISVFIFYIVAETNLRENGEETPSYKEIFEVVVLFSVFKTPIKMVGYGLSVALEGYAGLHRLGHLFEKCTYVPPEKQRQVFKRVYPNPSMCFESQLVVEGCQQEPNQIELNTQSILRDHKGELVMILGKIDASPNCDEYLNNIEAHLKYTGYCKIGYSNLIEDKSIRDNILFGSEYDEKKYNEVLEIVNLKDKINRFPEGDSTRMDENYFKTIYVGIAFKIQMARAIYSDIPIILLNRIIFKEYESILKKTGEYRKKKGQTTIIVNLSGSSYHIADWLIVLGKNGQQEGTYKDLIQTSSILKEFEASYLEHIDLKTDDKTSAVSLSKLQTEQIDWIKTSYVDYFKFYNLSHLGAGVVLLLILALPPLLDLYMEVIIAESAHGATTEGEEAVHASYVSAQETTTDEEQLNFDHIITLRYGIAALVFVVMNFLKILIFTIYLKISGYKIVRNVIDSFLSAKIQNTLSASNRKSALNLERNIESIDTRITADLDVGITIIFQQLTALIFGAVSSALFLAIGVPFLIVTFLIIGIMVFYNRSIIYVRREARSKFNSFIKKFIVHRRAYKAYQKDDYIVNQFIDHNKYDIKADLNTQWLLEALGILLEIVFILLLIITIAVSLTKFEQISTDNEAFLELAISFLIGMTNGARINLKIFQSMDMQIVGITSIFKIISLHETNKSEEIRPFPDNRLFTIEYRNFSIKFQDDVLHNVNLKIKAGERIVITGSRRGGKRVAFYALLGIFQPEHILGDIHLNRLPIYKEKITRQSLSNLVYILENQSLTFSGETVAEAIKIRAPRRDNIEIKYALEEMWRVLDMKPLFTQQTPLKELTPARFDLFALIRALMVRPQILVIEGGMIHIDSLNRKKLTRWLVENNEISILVDLTNRIEVINEYPRLIEFKEGVLVKDEVRRQMMI